eukprot:9270499-Pyramimonas_sp.AAC.1
MARARLYSLSPPLAAHHPPATGEGRGGWMEREGGGGRANPGSGPSDGAFQCIRRHELPMRGPLQTPPPIPG